jgi:haloacid dehalogenase-like hydrolase
MKSGIADRKDRAGSASERTKAAEASPGASAPPWRSEPRFGLAPDGWRSRLLAHRSRHPRPTPRSRTRCARSAPSSSLSACARTRPTRWPFFGAERVALKVLSGDNPATVGAITRDAGIPADIDALDGGALPEGDEALLAAVRAAPAIGRISPADKARVVRVLVDGGEYVGMVGDGVNDVPALKQARLAIAQGSGTQMARTVSDLVLVSGEFGEVPRMVHEGRQICATSNASRDYSSPRRCSQRSCW